MRHLGAKQQSNDALELALAKIGWADEEEDKLVSNVIAPSTRKGSSNYGQQSLCFFFTDTTVSSKNKTQHESTKHKF